MGKGFERSRRHSPARGRIQREREEHVPERIVDGDLQLACQPQQTIVVGQLAVTRSGAHGRGARRSTTVSTLPLAD